jgi:hypothetical protein
MASDIYNPVSCYILLLHLFDSISHTDLTLFSLLLHLFQFNSGYGQFFNDSTYDQDRVEYLSGYIGSMLTALRYISVVVIYR